MGNHETPMTQMLTIKQVLGTKENCNTKIAKPYFLSKKIFDLKEKLSKNLLMRKSRKCIAKKLMHNNQE